MQTINRARSLCEEGQGYEAHEILKSFFHRMRKKGSHEAAFEACKEGSIMQIEQGSFKAGAFICHIDVRRQMVSGN